MNFLDILRDYDIEIAPESHHHARDGWVQFDCPFCGKDSHKFHAGYNLNFGYVNCWRCGSHSVETVLMQLTGLSAKQCSRLIKDFDIKKVFKEKPKGKLILPKGLDDLSKAHKNYLRSRGFDPKELVRLWKLQGIGIAPKLSWRIFIPVHYKGKIVSWTTRTIAKGASQLRYVSASASEESISHKTLLYGEDYCDENILIVEGCFDVWRIGKGCVATLGTGYSRSQILKMLKYRKRFICFDNEKPAQERARKLCSLLSLYSGETTNIVLDSKDAGEASEKEIKKLKSICHLS